MTPETELTVVLLAAGLGFVLFLGYLMMHPKGVQHPKENMNTPSTLELVIVVALSILSFAVALSIMATIAATVLYLAWNAFMPAVFGAREITFGQAFALTFLLSAIKGMLSFTTKEKKES